MNNTEVIKILTEHNQWRRGGDNIPHNPETIGKAIDAAIELLERKRDPHGFLINTDIDDTMSKPLSDKEIEVAAKDYAENENSAYTNDYYGFIQGANFANRPQAGWIDVPKNRQVDYIGLAAMFIKRDEIESIVTGQIANSIPYYYCTHWMPITLPLPPKPKQ